MDPSNANPGYTTVWIEGTFDKIDIRCLHAFVCGGVANNHLPIKEGDCAYSQRHAPFTDVASIVITTLTDEKNRSKTKSNNTFELYIYIYIYIYIIYIYIYIYIYIHIYI